MNDQVSAVIPRAEISAVIGRVPVTVRDQFGITREIVLLVSERGQAWPVSWIELPREGTG